jgi:hypothetical protein
MDFGSGTPLAMTEGTMNTLKTLSSIKLERGQDLRSSLTLTRKLKALRIDYVAAWRTNN